MLSVNVHLQVLSQSDRVENHFGLDPVRAGTDPFADSLLAWYAAKTPSPDTD
jgi:hypothetical protein